MSQDSRSEQDRKGFNRRHNVQGAAAVDGEEEEDVARGGVGVGEGVEVLELGCPGAL